MGDLWRKMGKIRPNMHEDKEIWDKIGKLEKVMTRFHKWEYFNKVLRNISKINSVGSVSTD